MFLNYIGNILALLLIAVLFVFLFDFTPFFLSDRTFHSCFLANLIYRKRWFEMFFNSFICFIINDKMLFKCISCFSSVSLEDTRLITSVFQTFHVSYFWRLFLILPCMTCSTKVFLISSIWFLSPYLHVQYDCYYKN